MWVYRFRHASGGRVRSAGVKAGCTNLLAERGWAGRSERGRPRGERQGALIVCVQVYALQNAASNFDSLSAAAKRT